MKKLVISLLFPVFIFAASPQSIVSKICYECHGIKMSESCMGVSRAPNTLSQSQIIGALLAYRSGNRSEYGLGSTMTEKVSNLTNEEIVSLANYIITLK